MAFPAALTLLSYLNLAASSASAIAAALALQNPASLSGSQQLSSGEIFYARMYAARSIPLGIAVGILPLLSRGGTAVAGVVVTAGVIQLLDVGIAVGKRDWGMAVGASVGAIIHLVYGLGMM